MSFWQKPNQTKRVINRCIEWIDGEPDRLIHFFKIIHGKKEALKNISKFSTEYFWYVGLRRVGWPWEDSPLIFTLASVLCGFSNKQVLLLDIKRGNVLTQSLNLLNFFSWTWPNIPYFSASQPFSLTELLALSWQRGQSLPFSRVSIWLDSDGLPWASPWGTSPRPCFLNLVILMGWDRFPGWLWKLSKSLW